MIGFYIHINGTPIQLIEALNVTECGLENINGMATYEVQWLGGQGTVKHKRSDGWEGLIKCIIEIMEEDFDVLECTATKGDDA